MFKFLSSFFWSDSSTETELTLDEAYKIIHECKDEPKDEIVNDEIDSDHLENYETCNKIGKITKVSDGNYLIDDLYTFKSDLKHLFVGTEVSYQIFRSLGELRVVNIHVLENDWNVVATGKNTWYIRTLICSVRRKEGRSLNLTPGDISLNLNDISCEFIPIVGDWVELEVKCEVDENVVDLSGKIIEINKISPVRPQAKMGKITQWDYCSNEGVMDLNIYINRQSLYLGYVPVVGDKVAAEIIESTQKRCVWRALKLLPDYLKSKTAANRFSVKEEDFEETHPGLTITENVNLRFSKLGETKLFLLEVVNSSLDPIQLVTAQFPKLNGQCRVVNEVDHFPLQPNQPITINCECKVKNAGETKELLVFHFDTFKMRRWINIAVADGFTGTSNRYAHKNKEYTIRTERHVIRGEKATTAARFVQFRLPDFPLSQKLFQLIIKHQNDRANLTNELEKTKPSFITPLNYMNYEDKFHSLIHLDEIHTVLEMQNYDQDKACFIRNGEFLLLEIENLAEKRPSVIAGDKVIARNLLDSTRPDFEGFIHRTAKNHVYIKFSQIFHDAYNGEDFGVTLIASRTTYRREHYAVGQAVRNLGKDWLFPTRVEEKLPQVEFVFDSYHDLLSNKQEEQETESFKNKPSHNIMDTQRILDKLQTFQDNNSEAAHVPKLEWYNNNLNYYQKEAVRNVLLGVCRPLPYIVFGPPGTGKTVTLVEIILQTLRVMPHSRILVAAPSNSAADLLALRLIDSGVVRPGDLIRLLAITAVAAVPAKLAPYCATANMERDGTETSQPVVTSNGMVLGYTSSVIGRHRVTVTTCCSAALLYALGFPKGHFTHVIVDEAGQASEPSVLIPLTFLDTFSGQCILAGDPMQLGPVILSQLAAHYGLDESLLERFINRFPYLRDPEGFPKNYGYDPRLITKLVYNYRALPDLLKLPSGLFYNDDLQATVSDRDSPEALLLQQLKDVLPQTTSGRVPAIIFHGVQGQNRQTEDSPSWYNPQEAAQVFFYINELFRGGLKSQDIGVITPYKAQSKQLMDLLKEADFDVPKIGTVEEFQGQEYNVIILSTVRSSNRYVESDVKHSLGFISSPRRLNVSITRSKALLIIVGNPNLLIIDRCWRSVINYCIEKGTFIGCSIEQ